MLEIASPAILQVIPVGPAPSSPCVPAEVGWFRHWITPLVTRHLVRHFNTVSLDLRIHILQGRNLCVTVGWVGEVSVLEAE